MDLAFAQLDRAFEQLGALIQRRVQELESGGAPRPTERLVPELDGRFLRALLELEIASTEETVESKMDDRRQSTNFRSRAVSTENGDSYAADRKGELDASSFSRLARSVP
ncbi:MAG: hypothetical protein DIU78_003995 [Pseudomonadota bacterium]|nr:MAG: hypothetical protein DIU78_08650 [Pseudomonadota bacterium]